MFRIFTLAITSLMIIQFSSCKSDSSPTNTTPKAPEKKVIPGEPITLEQGTLYVADISATDFEKTGKNSDSQKLVEQFCQKSKGYASNEWPGKNDCNWAIEKYQIEKDKSFVNRKDGALTIKTNSGQNTILKDTDGKQHQYKGILAQFNAFAIQIYNANKCVETHLIQQQTGNYANFKGQLYPAPIGKYFVLYNQGNDNCKANITMNKMEAKDNAVVWEYTHPNWKVDVLKWANPEKILLKLRGENGQFSYKSLHFPKEK